MFDNISNYFYTLYSIYESSELSFKILFWILVSCGFAWLFFEFYGYWIVSLIQRHKNRKENK